MATSTYDPYNAVKMIYGLKNDWDNYSKAGDTANKTKTTESAQKYYQELINNGYANVADELSKNNYTNAKKIYDKYATAGKTQVNSYLGSLGSSYGLNQAQIDALLSTNPAGEMTFGGKVIGTPYSNVDGLAYWDDTVTLDNVFDDYIGRSGIQKSITDNSFLNQYNKYVDENRIKANEIFDKIAGNNDTASQNTTNRVNDLWATITGDKANLTANYAKLKDFNYSNPFETETGKSVLERYDLAALQGRDNQAASGGANNSGNIDSYSSANALRQQAYLRNLGEQSALAAHDRTVNSGRGILSDQGNYYSDLYNKLGGLIDTEANAASSRNQDYISLLTKGYIEPTQQYHDNIETTMGRLFNQGETSRLNTYNMEQDSLNQAENRASTRAGVSGNVDDKTLAIQGGLIDEKGNILNPNIDYHAAINQLKKLYDNTTDPQERQNIVSKARAFDYTRKLKTGTSEYGKFAGDDVDTSWMYSSTPTLANKQGVELQTKLAELNSGDYRYGVDSNLSGIKDTNASNVQMNNSNIASQERMYAIEAELKKMGYNNEERQIILNAANQADQNYTNRYTAETQANAQKSVAETTANANNYAVDKDYELKTAEQKLKDVETLKQLNYDYGAASVAQKTAQSEHNKLIEIYKQKGYITLADIDNALLAIMNLSSGHQWDNYAENVEKKMKEIFRSVII